MGMTVEIDTLEEMCDLMCDNKLPTPKKKKEGWWIFTFGCGQKHAGKFVRIWGTASSARTKMIEKYGLNWAFQYSEKEWKRMEKDPNRHYTIETELEVIK